MLCTSLKSICDDLRKEVLESESPSLERCTDIMDSLAKEKVSFSQLETTGSGKFLKRAIRSIKRHNRTSSDNWSPFLQTAKKTRQKWKDTVAIEGTEKRRNEKQALVDQIDADGEHFPKSVTEYKNRLMEQKKEV